MEREDVTTSTTRVLSQKFGRQQQQVQSQDLKGSERENFVRSSKTTGKTQRNHIEKIDNKSSHNLIVHRQDGMEHRQDRMQRRHGRMQNRHQRDNSAPPRLWKQRKNNKNLNIKHLSEELYDNFMKSSVNSHNHNITIGAHLVGQDDPNTNNIDINKIRVGRDSHHDHHDRSHQRWHHRDYRQQSQHRHWHGWQNRDQAQQCQLWNWHDLVSQVVSHNFLLELDASGMTTS